MFVFLKERMKKLLYLVQLLTTTFLTPTEEVSITTVPFASPEYFPYVLRKEPLSLHVFILRTVDQKVDFAHLIISLGESDETKTVPKSLFQWTKQATDGSGIESVAVHKEVLELDDDREYLLKEKLYSLRFRNEKETKTVVVNIDTNYVKKEHRIWNRFRSTTRFQNFMFFSEYCRFPDRQKRALNVSFTTITPKNHYLLFGSEIVFQNCLVDSYKVVSVFVSSYALVENQNNSFLKSENGEFCLDYEINNLVSNEKVAVKYKLGWDSLQVTVSVCPLRLLETPTISVGLHTPDAQILFNGTKLREETKHKFSHEIGNRTKAETNGAVEFVVKTRLANKCGVKGLKFKLPTYSFSAEMYTFYKIKLVSFVKVECEKTVSVYLWNRTVFVQVNPENRIQFVSIKVRSLSLQFVVPLEVKERTDGKWTLTYGSENGRLFNSGYGVCFLNADFLSLEHRQSAVFSFEESQEFFERRFSTTTVLESITTENYLSVVHEHFKVNVVEDFNWLRNRISKALAFFTSERSNPNWPFSNKQIEQIKLVKNFAFEKYLQYYCVLLVRANYIKVEKDSVSIEESFDLLMRKRQELWDLFLAYSAEMKRLKSVFIGPNSFEGFKEQLKKLKEFFEEFFLLQQLEAVN